MAALAHDARADRRGAALQPLLHPSPRRAAATAISTARSRSRRRACFTKSASADPRPRPKSAATSASMPAISAGSLGQFEKSGLIRKERSPSDGRQSFLSITADGPQGHGASGAAHRPADRRRAAPPQRSAAGPAGHRDAHGRADDRATSRGAPRNRAARTQARRSRLGRRPPRRRSMRRNSAGAKISRACARRSSPSSSRTTTPSANAAGSPRWTARMSARCSW